MTFDNKIRDEKLQYNNNREAAKMSVLSPAKIDKCKYVTCEEIFTDQSKMIEQAYSPLGKAVENNQKLSRIKGEKTSSNFKSFKS